MVLPISYQFILTKDAEQLFAIYKSKPLQNRLYLVGTTKYRLVLNNVPMVDLNAYR